ncbi:MAG: cellulase family glycosylhydrolase [candidate division KSB1 bacterium]|nr:cellulase family glycosylhydrolase [candidate division KSB1 bacterium]
MRDISTRGNQFIDRTGRSLILRGVNLAGSSKIPFAPLLSTHCSDCLDHETISFVGRPFPLNEADEHFDRLKRWGFRFIRLLTTWEAIEHRGPGRYDKDYIEYMQAVVEKAAAYGLEIFIDPHQDVWSRFTGGDGAPRWTLEAVGFDIDAIHDTGAAIRHHQASASLPPMVWPSNYSRLAPATMFTLFFAGNDFAPDLYIDGTPVQEFLQSHYIHAVKHLARALKSCPNVIGLDTLNEPSRGWIGHPDLSQRSNFIQLGPCPTPFQAMLLGSGIKQEVGNYTFDGMQDTIVLNQKEKKVWRDGFECIWKRHGVWDMRRHQPVLFKPDYFATRNGKPVNFLRDYFKPFALKFTRSMREVSDDYLIFLETIVENRHLPDWTRDDPDGMVNADHWYDEHTLLTKAYSSDQIYDHRTQQTITGQSVIEDYFAGQLIEQKAQADQFLNGIPTIIGEFGIPFDMEQGSAFRSGDYSQQTEALDRSYRVMEKAGVSCVLWNYTPDNDHAHGDQWNQEDLSIFSQDDRTEVTDPNSGGRAVQAFARVYPYRLAGKLLEYSFDIHSRRFELSFEHDDRIAAPSEIVIPPVVYPEGFDIQVSDGYFMHDKQNDCIFYSHTADKQNHHVIITPAKS